MSRKRKIKYVFSHMLWLSEENYQLFINQIISYAVKRSLGISRDLPGTLQPERS